MSKSHPAGWAPGCPTPAQIKEFFAQIERGQITKKRLQSFLKGQKGKEDITRILNDWQDFYLDVFDIEIDLTNIKIPHHKKGFDRLVVVIPGMTPQRIYDKCAELFSSWKWTERSLDKIVQSDRTPNNGPYGIWVRERVEADEELKNLSANTLEERSISGITLEERLLMELKYFQEFEEHLDLFNITMCSGSHDDGGDVPSVSWYGSQLRVYCYPGSANDSLRSRQIVSL